VINQWKTELGIIGVTTLFILANAYLSTRNIFILNALPFILIVGLYLFFSLRNLFFLLVFLIPLSIPLFRLVPGLQFDFWFPTEPILFSILIVLILKSFKERYFDQNLLGHPVFLSILFYLGWLFICMIPSEMPLVSAKYIIARLWFIGVFFYLGFLIFKSDSRYFKIFIWSFIAGLFIVSFYTIIKQIGLGIFNQKAANGACAPFFIDHTSYGATIAFLIPMLVCLIFISRRFVTKFLVTLLTVFFLFALVFSYSRAAWLSVAVAGGIWFIWFIRIKFSVILFGILVVFGLLFAFQQDIGRWLRSNTTDSSGDLKKHLNSALNVSTDASNLERINRWNSAIRMFEERPMFGWGPGTYMFCYAPFQRSYERTIISTNFGTGGNAHSEYLGLLSEAGVLGALSYVLILLFTFYRGFYISRKINDRTNQILLIGALLGLVTYTIHGGMNDFLDMDKIATPFWGAIAFIVALDVNYRVKEKENLKELKS